MLHWRITNTSIVRTSHTFYSAPEIHSDWFENIGIVRGRSFFRPGNRLEHFLRGLKFFGENLRGLKKSSKILRGLKSFGTFQYFLVLSVLQNLRGAKKIAKKLRGLNISSKKVRGAKKNSIR